MLRHALLLLLVSAFAFQAASAGHLVPGVYTARGTVEFRIEDIPSNSVTYSCPGEAFSGVLRVTGPTTAELFAHEGAGGCSAIGQFHWVALEGTPQTGYRFYEEYPCYEFVEVVIGPLGPATTFLARSAYLEQYPGSGAASPVASESSAACIPDDGWCVCRVYVSEGILAFE